ncbi:MAG: glycosyltransferase family 39 protein [Flavobacteriales bacterium]|jgi:4-amino-4-deoxy-L-arabinose transferase-like glycosyltransferase|uniref:ArnT family glycosyltransferase n=1 Tax=Candidatus Ulvibacter alkanivorans TaxID=2267620 RepID=UPI000DF2056E|nr:glycosyltransferase family 39 protein [Candidatus Ulvibacter alkanivorans]MCH2489646.1 glycosyltransferase family 39 protein [Flavobacteriales bacterium]
MKALANNHIFWLILACVAIFFVNLDALFVNIMEARNFITAREMLHDNNWLLTTMNGEARYEKPPLPTWITALSASIFGLDSLFALRLPAAIMGLLLVLATYIFSAKIFNNTNLAFVGALTLTTSFYVVSASRDANWDIYTHAFMMVCIYQLYLLFSEEKNKFRHALVAALFFGFSFMSKGPVSLYALLLPFLIAFGIVYKYKNMRSRIIPIVVFVLLGLLLSGWWHWYTYTYDPELVAAITEKETSNWTGYNVRPFYYYWSFFTQSGVWTIMAFVGLLYPYLKNKVISKEGYRFSFLWTVLSVVLLSIIPEKKSRYLLPVLIPLAINTAFYLEYLFRRFADLTDKRETIPVYFNFGLIASIGLIFPIGGYFFLKDHLTGKWGWFILLSVLLFVIGFMILRFLLKKQINIVFYLIIAFIAAITCFGMPLAKTLTVNPEFTSFAKLKNWQEDTGIPVYEFSDFSPELIWAYGKPINVLQEGDSIAIPSEEQFGVLITKDDQERFYEVFEDFSVAKIRRYDMNPHPPESRSHKVRLWRDLFVVTKP